LVIFLAAVFTKKIWLGHGKVASYAALVGSLVLFYLAYYYFFDAVHI
jgi:divalent metal cation (Fe/Co/Zn/Cd) transporter